MATTNALNSPLLNTVDPADTKEGEGTVISMEEDGYRYKELRSSLTLTSSTAFLVLVLFLLCCFVINSSKSYDPASFNHGDHVPNGPRAHAPPRGWNSYDSFSWTINETQFISNAEILADKFLRFGYQYVVVDFLWYRKMKGNQSTVWSSGFDTIDEWGRPVPDPIRWPSSIGNVGFRDVSARVHKLGLKFGIHVMRGISTQAINDNTLILGPEGRPYESDGRVWRARDIALPFDPCKWMPNCFTSVNTSLGAGRAFLESLYKLYDDWGVDFVKHDCVYGDDLNLEEVSMVSEIMKSKTNSTVYSISPGTHVTLEMAEKVKEAVNMYRVTSDDWDSWKDLSLHFDVARDFALGGFIGDKGLLGRSWPDLDMLPFGWLTDPNSNEGPHRNCSLTLNEQKTQMTLWAVAKSPLFLGGDLQRMDPSTMVIVTNTILLDMHNRSINNREHNKIRINSIRIWVADGLTGEEYVAIFNLDSSTRTISIPLEGVTQKLKGRADSISASGHGLQQCRAFDVWDNRDLGHVNATFSATIPMHGCILLVLNCS